MTGRDDDHSIKQLDVCAHEFRTINSSLREIKECLQLTRDASIRTDASSRSAWHAIRDDLKPAVENLNRRVDSAIKDHSRNCPAAGAFLIKASAARTIPPRPVVEQGDSAVSSLAFFGIPKGVLKGLLGLGVVVGGAVVAMWKAGVFN